jgi:hypothetical protein
MAGSRNPFVGPSGGASRPAPVVVQPASPTQQRSGELDIKEREARLRNLLLNYDRTRNTPLPQGPKPVAQQVREATALKRANIIGEKSATAEAGLPKAEMTAKTALTQLGNLMKQPGFEAAVGLPNPFRGGLGFGTVPGTSARDFTNSLDKVKAGAFLQAIEALRGTGAISEVEGKAATAALNNMSTSTSENEFKRNAQEYAGIITNGLNVGRKTARLGSTQFSYDQLKAEQERRKAGKK